MIISRCKSFQVGSDLIGHITCNGSSVTSYDAQINHPVLHQMAACIIGNNRMGNTFLSQFPGSEACSLIPGPCFIHPNMYFYTLFKSLVYGRCGSTPIDAGQPSRVAMGKNIDYLSFLLIAYLFNQRTAEVSNGFAMFNLTCFEAIGFFKGQCYCFLFC